jgi:YYY domain-containing protein
MPNRRVWLLLLLALMLRLPTLWWDSGLQTPHPDERQVGYVTERIEGWFDDPGFYAYGSLHFQAVRLVSAGLALTDHYKGLLMGGRVLSLLAVLVAIAIGWWMTRRAWGRRTSDLYLLLAAWIPLDIQQSHFATVEAHHTVWVVVALAACYWLGTRASRASAVLAGAAIGASLAVKVASLGMVVPLAAALFVASRSRDWLRAVELAATGITAAGIAFWLAQPWAFEGGRPPLAVLIGLTLVVVLLRQAQARSRWARAGLLVGAGVVAVLTALGAAGTIGTLVAVRLNPAYLRGVGEQVAMVVGAADLPYVRVYHGTLPLLYPLRELLRWGTGPLVLVAMVGAGSGMWWLLRRWRRLLPGRWTDATTLLVVMLAWLVPMTARLGTLQVKYLRYWEPLVVPGVMVAAWALQRAPRRWRRRAVTATVAVTVLWGLTYLWAFTEPHPHRTASEWLQMMVDSDHVVAFEHWDETVPLPGVERIELPSYELPDDDAKIRQLGSTLARADWLVLTSNRVRRTVLVNPERFPRTARLYRLLLAGEAGYQPLTRVDRGPRLFGLLRPVQLADESFLNYDFPRVVVLRRVEEVDPGELVERTQRPLPYREHLGAKAVDRRFVETLPPLRPVPTATGQVVDVAMWLVVFAALAAGCWALLLPAVRGWPDAGVGLSVVTGWLAPAWLLWLGSELGVWRVGAATATGVLLLVVGAGALAAHRRRRLVARLWRQRRRSILTVLAVFAAVWLLFTAVRASNPAVFWGEKPMDFSFLNAFLRADAWPTGEPWMAGMPLHYYYFGEVLASFPILVAGTDPAVGYNLMSATIPALGAVALAALGLALVRRGRLAAASLMPLLVLLTGNLAWPFLLDMARSRQWFDLWWATSRVIPGFAIDEYPLWTTLFADLHGHFIALPVLIAAALWGWLAVGLRRYWPVAAVLCGICTAVLIATNPWDLFVLTVALGLGTLVAAERPLTGLLRLAVAAAASLAAGLPFIVELAAGIGAGAGGRLFHLTDADFAPAWAVVLHFGQFLLPLAALAAVLVVASRVWIFVVPLVAGAVVLGLSIGSSSAALGLAGAILFAGVVAGARDRVHRLVWAVAALGMAAVAACERFTLIDRMNTLFKVYNGVWVLLAVALAVLLVRERGWHRRLLVAVWAPLQLVAMVNLPLGIAQGWLQPRTISPRPTLDGQAFLADSDPQTWFLVRALHGVALPDEAVAEAAKIAYAEYTRIAMHTGQPTVVGWPWHLQQRGQSREEVDARYDDLTALYAGPDPAARRAVLDRYRVRWVVLADLERSTYGLEGSDPLVSVPGVVRLTERDGAALYRVRPSSDGAAVMATVAPRELPPELKAIGVVPAVAGDVVRSVAVDGEGGTVVLRDGTLLGLDLLGRPTASLADPPCAVTSVARRDGTLWVGCTDGGVWRAARQNWRRMGSVDGTAHVTAGRDLWAWGDGGLWRSAGARRWTRVARYPVTAAAARGPAVAVSDGERVWLQQGSGRRPVGDPLPGVRWLAWQGSVLWALTDDGLYRSGGGMLPWRQGMRDLERVSAVAGSEDRLWLVMDDGVLAQHLRPGCGSPWREESGLYEPRDLAVSAEGWFAVSDTQNHRLRWYTHRGACLDTFGEEGELPGQFREPSGIALAPDGTLAVSDTWNGRVQLLRPDGTVQMVGTAMYGPREVLWQEDGGLLVADTGNRLLLGFSPPRWERQELYEFEGPVVGLEWVGGLLAVAVPVTAEVVLLEPGTWTEARSLPVPGWGTGTQQEGYLLAVPSGELLASAPEAQELWLLDPAGDRPPRLLREGLPGVTGLALLPDGQVLVAQTWENRLIRIGVD